MRASNLSDALNIFDPKQPLRRESDLEEYFVERKLSPANELKLLLNKSADYQKILFSGPRGSGKSTELAKLALDLSEDFFVIAYSLKEVSNSFNINAESLLSSMAVKLLEKVEEEKIKKINPEAVDFLTNQYGREIIIERSVSTTGDSIKLLLASKFIDPLIKAGLEPKATSATTTFKETSKPGISKLVKNINLILDDIELNTRKDVLFIIMDMDKMSLEHAKTLFTKEYLLLNKLNCSIVLTFPLALKFLGDFVQIHRNFTGLYFLPYLNVKNQDETPNLENERKLEEMLLKRVKEKLFTGEAIARLVEQCGGVPLELINLVRHSCLIALKNDAKKIDMPSVQEAEERLRYIYDSISTPVSWEVLKKVHETKRIERDEALPFLMDSLCVLEYGVETHWYDVHPLLWPLLEQGEEEE